MSQFLHDNNDDAKAIAITRVFSKNSQAKNVHSVDERSDCTSCATTLHVFV